MPKKTIYKTQLPHVRVNQEHIDRIRQHADKNYDGNSCAAIRAWAMSLPKVKK